MANQWQEDEDRDWLRAEALLESSTVEEMLFFGANAGGMLVSFRSLVGFLPAWELSAQRRPPSFRTWAMDKGFTLKEPKFIETFIPDSSLSRVELPMGSRAVVGSETSKRTQESSIRVEDDNQRNLLKQYREERRNALSMLIGETARVVVIGLDRGRRRLRLSEKAAEGEGQELTQKKANVMEGLNVGDVVCCTVKKVTSYGAFVEVQGVPALIHISELSWNRIVDPTTVVAVGQELEAKVCRLDRFMQRINLSLKQMQVDPLRETLESLLDSTDMELETVDMAAEIDAKVQEIPEVNGVIKRLEQIKGIDSVVKGRCLQGMAMAPSFQVYLSGQLSNGYKLIARSGNQVQEVLVLTSLDRESAKQAILQCTMSDD
jgi:predicted RNA-binding protein with RPS1 domain